MAPHLSDQPSFRATTRSPAKTRARKKFDPDAVRRHPSFVMLTIKIILLKLAIAIGFGLAILALL